MIRFLAALLLLVGIVGTAQAESYSDQGSAYAGCLSATRALVAARNNPNLDGEVRCVQEGTSAYRGEFQHRTTTTNPYFWAQAGIHTFPIAGMCSARPPLTGGWTRVGSAGNTCSGGCAYSGGGSGNTMNVNGYTYVSKEGATPTGGVCDGDSEGGSDIGEEDCTTIDNLTQCVTSQGKHCAVATSGKKFCWNPSETGTKVSGNEAATKSPQGVSINPPPVPPKNNGQWQQGATGTASVSNGGTTTNYNVTSYTSNYGTEGEGGGAEGEGDGDGEGDGEGDEPGEGVGTLYEGTDRTVESVMSDFYNAVTNTQFVSGVTAFMTANGGGSCPTFTLPASQWWSAQTFDAHCSGQFLAMLQAMGWVVFAMACYIAVKIAVT